MTTWCNALAVEQCTLHHRRFQALSRAARPIINRARESSSQFFGGSDFETKTQGKM
jgi:hypothetical protein